MAAPARAGSAGKPASRPDAHLTIASARSNKRSVPAIEIAFLFLMSASFVYALVRGGPSERAIAVIMVISALSTPLVAHSYAQRFHGSESGIFAVDTVTLLAIIVVLLRSDRFWPIWTTAFQLLTVLAHLGPLIRTRNIAIPFAVIEEIWGYVIFAQLIIVTRMRSKMPANGRRPH